MPYDLFISYSRRDNIDQRVTDLVERIAADYLQFSGEELSSFFDKHEIHGMDDWRHKILDGLRQSQLFLLVLSPEYLKSPYCEWEVVEYLKYESARAVLGEGMAPIYFVTIPGLDKPGFEERAAAWFARVRRRQHFDLRPWFEAGRQALEHPGAVAPGHQPAGRGRAALPAGADDRRAALRPRPPQRRPGPQQPGGIAF